MNKKTKRQIIIFTEALGYVENAHIDHGTVYANFKNKEDALSYRKDLANFMNDFFVGDYKVKEWKLWKTNEKDGDTIKGIFKGDTWYPSKERDVYAFDIMEDDYIPHDVDVAINLENESRLGK